MRMQAHPLRRRLVLDPSVAVVPIRPGESEHEALGRHLLEQPADARPAVVAFYRAGCDDCAGINA